MFPGAALGADISKPVVKSVASAGLLSTDHPPEFVTDVFKFIPPNKTAKESCRVVVSKPDGKLVPVVPGKLRAEAPIALLVSTPLYCAIQDWQFPATEELSVGAVSDPSTYRFAIPTVGPEPDPALSDVTMLQPAPETVIAARFVLTIKARSKFPLTREAGRAGVMAVAEEFVAAPALTKAGDVMRYASR